MFGGAGNDTIYTGPGSMTVKEGDGDDTVLLGSGNAVLYGGAGADVYAAVAGIGVGTDVISGFKAGIDHITLFDYGSTPVQQTAGASTILALGDGTRIMLVGVSQLDASDILSA